MKTINNEIKNILLDNKWRIKSPRGFETNYKKNVQFEIDPLHPIIDSIQRPFNWKYFAGELAWFLSKNSDIGYISQFSKFWNNIADENNLVNSNYGTRLLAPIKNSQLLKVYETLIRDKDSRQAIAFISGKEFQTETKDFPCTVYINFSINDDKLDMTVRMRSNDIVFGLSYDAPWFSIIHQNLYLILREKYENLTLGMYTHSADDFHWYTSRHTKEIESFKTNLCKDYRFKLKSPLFIYDGEKLIMTKEAVNFNQTCKFYRQTNHDFYLALLSEFLDISLV